MIPTSPPPPPDELHPLIWVVTINAFLLALAALFGNGEGAIFAAGVLLALLNGIAVFVALLAGRRHWIPAFGVSMILLLLVGMAVLITMARHTRAH